MLAFQVTAPGMSHCWSGSMANSQGPLRDSQPARWRRGRGYPCFRARAKKFLEIGRLGMSPPARLQGGCLDANQALCMIPSRLCSESVLPKLLPGRGCSDPLRTWSKYLCPEDEFSRIRSILASAEGEGKRFCSKISDTKLRKNCLCSESRLICSEKQGD